ncbi:hypothetical protein [Pedobacter gandavensis]|uniref:hypothetical protein n=1 Tax=Pedobacter gandavensis TaxID=2679963 RepID=UPI00292E2559|nr:hypothetical protein [Pedobacter gandavensis]
MIIYNITWLKNLIIQDHLKKAHKANDLKGEELYAAMQKYPVGFHSSNVFMRIGLFLVTVTLTSFAFGFLSLVLSRTNLLESPVYYVFLGICCYVALEIATRVYHHYRSGVDDALMWTSGWLLLVALYIYLDKGDYGHKHFTNELILSGFITLLGSYFTLRFADLAMALLAFCAFIAFVFFGWYKYGFQPLSTMPFLMITLALLIYGFAKQLDKKHWVYNNVLGMVQIGSLLTAYAAGNYFIVRELGSTMNDVTLKPDQGIPFGWFFWLWTIGIPLIYIAMGLKRKEVILLRSGLILVAAAAFTFRSYYHVLPIEMMLVICGGLLLGLSYAVMRYLESPKHGFTAAELDDDQLLDKLKVESLIVSGTFGDGTSAPEGSRMGGGNFGGGGASSDF